MHKLLAATTLTVPLVLGAAQTAWTFSCPEQEPISERFKGLSTDREERLAEQLALGRIETFPLIARAVPISARLLKPDLEENLIYIVHYRILVLYRGHSAREIDILHAYWCDNCRIITSEREKEFVDWQQRNLNREMIISPAAWTRPSPGSDGWSSPEDVAALNAIPTSVHYFFGNCMESLETFYRPVDTVIRARLRWLSGDRDPVLVQRWGPPPASPPVE